MNDIRPVLVVGATGSLGGKIVAELLERGKPVRALVRPGSDATRLESQGVEIARGDMLDPDSLDRAMTDVDAVISSAAGYTKPNENALEIDTIGNTNLAEAAHRTAVRRFVFTSILTCDQAPHVSHFWHKKLAEDKLEQLGVPFVALRPGAFFEPSAQLGGDPFTEGRIDWFGDVSVAQGFVHTSDLAGYHAAAVDAQGIDGQRIDIGFDRSVGMTDVAQIATTLVGRQIRVRSMPVPMDTNFSETIAWFQSGRFVADVTRQREVFGTVPTVEDAVARLAQELGHTVRI